MRSAFLAIEIINAVDVRVSIDYSKKAAGHHLMRRIEAMRLFNFYPLSTNTLAKQKETLR
ncbi:hypothetical protein BM1_07003 [Bipolaris maydis]|nr:hypothetical protein BM1_07003 [Bipolaris maydis]